MKKIFLAFCLLPIASLSCIEKTLIDRLIEHKEAHTLKHELWAGFITGLICGTPAGVLAGCYPHSIVAEKGFLPAVVLITSIIASIETAKVKKESYLDQFSLLHLGGMGCFLASSMASYFGTYYVITQMIDFWNK